MRGRRCARQAGPWVWVRGRHPGGHPHRAAAAGVRVDDAEARPLPCGRGLRV